MASRYRSAKDPRTWDCRDVSRNSSAGLYLAGPSDQILIFLPGFLGRPKQYTDLLTPLAGLGLNLLIPNLHKNWRQELSGAFTAEEESRVAVPVVQDQIRQGRKVWLAGHSRGAQVAWRAAESLELEGLILIDPVDSDGRHVRPTVTVRDPDFELAPLTIGAGLGGRCAPAGVNHEAFAARASGPHLVLPKCGHADMLNDPARKVARRICPGGPDPDAQRSTLADLLALFVSGELDPRETANLSAQVMWLS